MISITVLTDGSSDRALLPIIRWTIIQAGVSADIQIEWADFRNLPQPPVGLVHRIMTAIALYPCDILFVHRDAEAQAANTRFIEIRQAIQQVQAQLPHVCVVPVRMLETWLLCDVKAIRTAADNPNGSCQISLPQARRRESIADPKEMLLQLLRTATELTGRRLRRFDVLRARTLVADHIVDFSPLRQLSSFQAFEAEVKALVRDHHFDNYK